MKHSLGILILEFIAIWILIWQADLFIKVFTGQL